MDCVEKFHHLEGKYHWLYEINKIYLLLQRIQEKLLFNVYRIEFILNFYFDQDLSNTV